MSKLFYPVCFFVLGLFHLPSTFAQSPLQIGVFGQYELARSNDRLLQLQGVNPALSIGSELDLPEADVGFYLYTRWERVRADSTQVNWRDVAIRENLLHDNLLLGPALQLIVFPKRKIQLLVGLEMFVGIPLRTEYEFFGPGTGIVNSELPSYVAIEGGATRLIGWQGYLGLRGKLLDQVNWQVRFGYGAARQSYNWDSQSKVGGGGDLFTGTHVYTSLGAVYLVGPAPKEKIN